MFSKSDYLLLVAAFFSFCFSVGLCFNGFQDEGLYVGIWVPSILAASIAIRQRRLTTPKRNVEPIEEPKESEKE